MSRKQAEQNEIELHEILQAGFNIERHIDNYERSAIDCGDLKRAIRYNWLRNAYKQGNLTEDDIFFQLMTIHTDEQDPRIK